MEELLGDILSELVMLNRKVDEIVDKLPIIAPVYSIDDVYIKIGELAEDIAGPARYNLGDLHLQLVEIEAAIQSK